MSYAALSESGMIESSCRSDSVVSASRPGLIRGAFSAAEDGR